MRCPVAQQSETSAAAPRGDCRGKGGRARIESPPAIDDDHVYVRCSSGKLNIEDIVGLKAAMIVKICNELFDEDREPRCVDPFDPSTLCKFASSLRCDVDR